MAGIYIHVPFCVKKCPYCDFYSLKCDETVMDEYKEAVIRDILKYSGEDVKADTLYFGGGTPNLLGGGRTSEIIKAARQAFTLKNAEITVEVNPKDADERYFYECAEAGVNRVSLGMQSAFDDELKLLGRRHGRQDIKDAVSNAKRAGIDNISLDIMIGIPMQTEKTLAESIAFAANLDASHLSAYLLKIEKGTEFYNKRDLLNIADENTAADMYLLACECAEKHGFRQYEISNFCRDNKLSRHNIKYWRSEDYLGFGPSAHSFYKGKRFFYKPDISMYICGEEPVDDGIGGDFEEYAMLSLRLTDGLQESECMRKFSHLIPQKMRKQAAMLENAGLLISDEKGIRLTVNGFLLSNEVISRLIF